MKLSIIIVTWNSESEIGDCLDSVFNNQPSFDFEVFVVDNDSKDKTCQLIQKKYDQVALIANDFNAGFAKANNQAIEKASGEYLILLNPDTIVKHGALEKMVGFLEQNPETGIVGGKLLNPDGSFQIGTASRFPTIGNLWTILSGFGRPCRNSKSFRKYQMIDDDFSKPMEVDQIMGADLMFTRKLMHKVGVLDEGFWIWFEEVDFCKRAKDAGFKIQYLPSAEITHLKGRSFAQTPKLQKFFSLSRSILRYSRKHFGVAGMILIVTAWPIGLLVATLVSIFRISPSANLKS